MGSNRHKVGINIMSSINFTYLITAVDEVARCMEVVYSAEGHQTMHIGARLPFEGESLEDVVIAFAPIAYWKEQKLGLVVPAVGATGAIEVPMAPVFITTMVAPVDQPVVTGSQEL